MKRIFCIFIIVSLVLSTFTFQSCNVGDALNKELSAEEVFELASPSVVEIAGKTSKGTSTGTGFFNDDQGTVITNYHVIEDCYEATITLSNGKNYSVDKVMGYSEDKDIAILSTSCKNSTPLKIRKTEIKTGEKVYTIGSSLGLSGSLSDGIVSSAERIINGHTYIQITAPISHGNSGGPLLDSEGKVIGITTAYLADGQNLNLAIPVNEVSSISISNPMTLYDLFSSYGNNNSGEISSVGIRTIALSDKYTAEYVLASWENGVATESTMIEIMNEYGASQGGGRLYEISRGEFVQEIDEWCFAQNRKVGDYAIIENAYGYSICYISSISRKPSNGTGNENSDHNSLGVSAEQYKIATLIADDPTAFCEYLVDLSNILSKGTYGYDVKVEKATDYINNLPLDYGQRIILFRMIFIEDTTYCNDILDYLNEREDITYDEEVYILEELGFAVFDDGTVKW